MAKRDYTTEINKKYGKLTIKEVYREKGRVYTKCDCECGNKHSVRLDVLESGRSSSCGCSQDLTGKKFNRLLVLEKTKRRKGSKIVYKCLCDCDNTTYVATDKINNGHTKSCGCLSTSNGEHHGLSGSSTYTSWENMNARCYNPSKKRFEHYGGRGIKVCDEWRHSFETFYKDMGERPEGTSLDRIDVDGDYSPSNCRWATVKEQNRNKRNNRLLTFNDKTQCITDWADEINISVSALRHRLKNMSVEKALTKPLGRIHSSRYRDECTIHT